MKHPTQPRAGVWALALILALALVVSNLGHAQSGGGYDLSWWTVADGGGSSSRPGSYSLSGAAGQPAAGELSGTGYHLSGGFWVGGGAPIPQQHKLYLPLVMR